MSSKSFMAYRHLYVHLSILLTKGKTHRKIACHNWEACLKSSAKVLSAEHSFNSFAINEAGRNQSLGCRAVCLPVAESNTLRNRIFSGVTSTISPSRMNSIARSSVIGIIGVNTTFSSFPEAR